MTALTAAQTERGREFAESCAEVPYEWPTEQVPDDD